MSTPAPQMPDPDPDQPHGEAMLQAWLAVQCPALTGLVAAVVLWRGDHGSYTVAGRWPDNGTHLSSLVAMGVAAAHAGKAAPRCVGGAGKSTERLAWAFTLGDQQGALAIEVTAREEITQRNIVKQFQTSLAWLDFACAHGITRDGQTRPSRFEPLVDVLAALLEQNDPADAAFFCVHRLAQRLQCGRVAIGRIRDGRMRVVALSDAPDVDTGSAALDDLRAAMEEAHEQRAGVAYPPPEEGEYRIVRAHRNLADHRQAGAVCSVPLVHQDRVVGILTLERRDGPAFDQDELEWLELLAGMAGPVLDLKERERRGLGVILAEAVRRPVKQLLGPDHPWWKLGGLAAALLLAASAVLESDYRVTARAVLEGSIQRALVAPIKGFVAEAHAKAGDVVKAGDALAVLDDRDLQLSRTKWVSQQQQVAREYREALAAYDRAKVSVLQAQLGQAEAEIALLDEQLARTRIAAPFEGVLIEGDLSQSLGAPVDQGQLLFKIAPLDGYRIILQVDDRDITHVAAGQTGQLTLSSLPDRELPLVVETITPVAVAADGRNYFRVEARLDGEPARLLPGMEGVGKIGAGRRTWFWIATHRLFDWLRLSAWDLLP